VFLFNDNVYPEASFLNKYIKAYLIVIFIFIFKFGEIEVDKIIIISKNFKL